VELVRPFVVVRSLDVDAWTRSRETYESLQTYLKEEEAYAARFAARSTQVARDELAAERKQMMAQMATLEAALKKAASERLSLVTAVKEGQGTYEEMRLKDAEQAAVLLREKLADTQQQARLREEQCAPHLTPTWHGRDASSLEPTACGGVAWRT
jgi:hypothetical protein